MFFFLRHTIFTLLFINCINALLIFVFKGVGFKGRGGGAQGHVTRFLNFGPQSYIC